MRNQTLYNKIKNIKAPSKWAQGVKEYALELVEQAESELTLDNYMGILLNGAKDWEQYSYGGCSLIYNGDICERLATPSEQKRTKMGELNPNSREEWLDTQARALHQASLLVKQVLEGRA